MTTENLTDESLIRESAISVTNWRLTLLVFVSGAVLMGLEMAGSRVLAAHFGSSIYVWGSIIGIFLAALSGGYFIGGLAADRKPSFLLLNVLVLVAGCWLLLLPLYANYVCRVIRSASLGARLEPLLATALLFGGPSILMGMVSPFAVRLAASAIDRIGNTAGRLYAISTIGSIVGTLVTAFWLIPAIGVNTILKALGLTLIAFAIIGLPRSRATLVMGAVALFITVPALLLRSAPFISLRSDQHVRFEGDSAYHHVMVVDDQRSGRRLLRFNNQVQSIIDQKPPYNSDSYTNSFELARIFKPKLTRVLFIGGGGAIGPRDFLAHDREVKVDVVEIDPLVVDISRDYFHLQDDGRLKIYVEDGRRFVRRTTDKYDLVILDAFTAGGQIPFHLATQEFMQEIKNVLTPDGLFLSNIISALEGPRSQILRAEYKTAASVFPSVYLFPRPFDIERDPPKTLVQTIARNVMLIGLNAARTWSPESIASTAASLTQQSAVRSPTFLNDAFNLH
ncbi:MAG TPA: fused MFS/spermidine synthase, partial [Pyrinomonadaceae bacterium]|nr:fused MFS/spermidine synthase [Pyrinomonadaceae bacterium]